jgi:hypothetical protein
VLRATRAAGGLSLRAAIAAGALPVLRATRASATLSLPAAGVAAELLGPGPEAALGLPPVAPLRRLRCALAKPGGPGRRAGRNAEGDLHGPVHVFASAALEHRTLTEIAENSEANK